MRSSFSALALVVPFALSTAACSLLHPGGAGDAGASDGGPTASSEGGSSAGGATADNANDVARFPDEVGLNNAGAKLGEHAVAHNSVPGGTTVATLTAGTDVTQLASHEGYVLATFSDPKNSSRLLEGWIPQGAFGGGNAAPPKGGCAAGQMVLIGPDQKDFCGRVCKVDKDCPSGETCSGTANLSVAGKAGPATSTCTVPSGPAPTPTTPTATIAGVQEPPGAGGACAAKYIKASDGLCHFECNKNPLQCPPHSRCTAHLTTPTTPVCEPNP